MAVVQTIRGWLGMSGSNGGSGGVALADIQDSGVSPPGREDSASANPQSPTPNTGISGIVGTAFFSGQVRDLGEYNPKLQPPWAFQIYEKMRRSDADVASVLLACKLPIRAAEYQVLPGVDDNDPGFARAQEIADFVEENLFGGLEYVSPSGIKVSQSFERVVHNALLALDFGCAAHENVWAVDGSDVRLARLAPRLPSTFYRFLPDSDGETLMTLEQQGYRGDKFVTVPIPASKLAFFSFDQEGANFWGRSILRAAYKHWYQKERLEIIECIGNEKNSLGIPTMTQGPSATKEDRDNAEQWVKRLAAHEQTGLSLPNGWEFKLQGVEGEVRKPLEMIRYCSEMIGRSALATFLAYGTTQTGARALGESSTEFFKLSLESLAWLIAETITQATIRPLVDYNFGPQPAEMGYPYLRFGNILATDPLKVLAVVKDLAAAGVGLIEPDDEAEAWAREQLGMPKKSVARPRPAVQGLGISGQGLENQTPNPKPPTPNPEEEALRASEENGQWITLESGTYVFIGPGGVITKGPKEFVGKKRDELGKPGGVQKTSSGYNLPQKPSPQGKGAAGGGKDAVVARATRPDEFGDLKEHHLARSLSDWQDAHENVDGLQAKAERLITRKGKLDPEYAPAAIVLGIRHGDEFETALYRGIRANSIEGIDELKAGKTIQFTKPQSFTKDFYTAENFTVGKLGAPPDKAFIFKTEGKVRGLDVNKYLGKNDLSHEQEVITAGRFRVVGVVGKPDWTEVTLSQEGVF